MGSGPRGIGRPDSLFVAPSLVSMPTYVYRREDGTTFETRQQMSAPPLEECPETGQSVERVITGSPGVILDSSNRDAPDDGAANGSCRGPLCGL